MRSKRKERKWTQKKERKKRKIGGGEKDRETTKSLRKEEKEGRKE